MLGADITFFRKEKGVLRLQAVAGKLGHFQCGTGQGELAVFLRKGSDQIYPQTGIGNCYGDVLSLLQ